MNKLFLSLIVLAAPLVFSGCSFFDAIDNPELYPTTVEEPEEVTEDLAADEITDLIEEAIELQDVEEKKKTVQDVFVGTWWFYQEYPDWKSESEFLIQKGEKDGELIAGTLQSLQSTMYEDDGTTEFGQNPEVVPYEIDGVKLDFDSVNVTFFGRITVGDTVSTATGTTGGGAKWYMTNVKPAAWPEF